MNLRTVFMGSPDFAIPTLRLLAEETELVGVVTQPDKPAGRGRELSPPPVKRLAVELGVPVIQPRRLREAEPIAQLIAWSPDVIVVAAFGQILRQNVLDLPRLGCLNVHASLLPRWRGAAPIQAAILAGDALSGVTIMKMDAGIDTGPTLSQRQVPILADDTADSLSERLARSGAVLLGETLLLYVSGALQPQAQPEHGATYAPMLKKEDGRLEPSVSAEELARRVRAFQPWPGAYLEIDGLPLKVLRAHAVPGAHSDLGSFAPGRRLTWQGYPALATSTGLLVLDEVQAPGKRPVSGKDYLRGARAWEQA